MDAGRSDFPKLLIHGSGGPCATHSRSEALASSAKGGVGKRGEVTFNLALASGLPVPLHPPFHATLTVFCCFRQEALDERNIFAILIYIPAKTSGITISLVLPLLL